MRGYRRYNQSLIVVCPKCGELGRLHYSERLGWYVKHGSRRTHSCGKNPVLEVPLHEPRLNIIRYAGGDSFLLPYICRMVPPHHTYVEVFGGGAPFLLNKPPSKVEVYNDLDGNLVNLFRVVRDRLDDFMERLKWVLVSREMYYDFIKGLRDGSISDPVDRAVAYYYVMRLAYAGKYSTGLGFGPVKNIAKDFWNTVKKLELIHERLKNVIVEQLDFREVIKRYDTPKTFFYLDPPHLYLSTEAVRGQEYYAVKFTDDDYMEMLRLLEKIKGKFLLKQSTNVPWLLGWARKHGFRIMEVKMRMTSRPDPRARRNPLYCVLFIRSF